MCCDQLVCASCTRPVAEAACSVCRTARAELHGAQPLPYAVLAAGLVLVLALALLLTGHVA
jgi:hypothetical protein